MAFPRLARPSRVSKLLILLMVSPSAWASDTYYFIAHAGPGDPYWSIQAKAAEDAAKKLGIRVIFSAPERPGDVAKQVELLDAAISADPAGIATTLPNAKAFEKSLKRAAKRAIPVVAVNTREAKRDAVALPYLAYIGMDELEAGRRVGTRAKESFMLKSGDSAVIANHEPGVMSLEQRTRGISEVLSAGGIKTQALDIGSDPTQAISILESYLKAHPKTRVIFTLGPLGYTPAGKVLAKSSGDKKIFLTGFDIDPVGLDLVSKGIMDFTLDAQPYMQAFMAVQELYLASHYAATPVDLNTGVGFLDQSNVKRLSKLIQGGYK